jgi:NADPH:quinone reductase-like Zn-dependent oxidoreductase
LRTKAAALFSAPGKWEIVEVDLESPRQDELLIKMAAAGLCHSDDHILTGDLPVPPEALPIIGGHEGAGVVAEVGPNTPGWKVGVESSSPFSSPAPPTTSPFRSRSGTSFSTKSAYRDHSSVPRAHRRTFRPFWICTDRDASSLMSSSLVAIPLTTSTTGTTICGPDATCAASSTINSELATRA